MWLALFALLVPAHAGKIKEKDVDAAIEANELDQALAMAATLVATRRVKAFRRAQTQAPVLSIWDVKANDDVWDRALKATRYDRGDEGTCEQLWTLQQAAIKRRERASSTTPDWAIEDTIVRYVLRDHTDIPGCATSFKGRALQDRLERK